MIRLADIHDIENIYRLIQKTIQIAYLDHYSIEAVTFFKNHHSIDSISKRLVQGEVLLIKERGKVVATGSLVGSEISGVFVDPDNQGQGLGQKVMHQLEVIAEKHGVVELVLDVS
ncbi:MAG: GNAT family N-acetyltransferase, partial [Desulforhopalus sp.]